MDKENIPQLCEDDDDDPENRYIENKVIANDQ